MRSWIIASIVGAVGMAGWAATMVPRALNAAHSPGSNLANRLAALREGGTVTLQPGSYGDLRIVGRSTGKPLVIMSAIPHRPATFSSISIIGSANINLSGLAVAFVPGPKTTTSDSALRVYRSTNVTLQRLRIFGGVAVNGVAASTPAGGLDATKSVLGQPTGRGISIQKSSNIRIDRNEVTSFFRGIVLQDAAWVRVTANHVHFLRTSPLVGSNLSNIEIEGNVFSDFHPWRFGGKGDHGDMVHFWTDHQTKQPIRGITIRSNWFRQGRGQALLGIYLDDNGGGFSDVLIDNNLIHNDNRQGMRLEGVRGRVVRNTLVQPQSERPKSAPGILVTNGSNVEVTSNVTGSVDHGAEGRSTDRDNLFIQRFDPAGPGYYAKILQNALRGGDLLQDFVLRDPAQQVGFDQTRMRAVIAVPRSRI